MEQKEVYTKTARCLNLEPLEIGRNVVNMGTEPFDDQIIKEFKASEDASYVLKETQQQLKKRYPSVYDGSNQSLITFPAQYNFGVNGFVRLLPDTTKFISKTTISL